MRILVLNAKKIYILKRNLIYLYEEANFIKETLTADYDIREISLIQDKTNLDGTIDDNPDQTFESVDQIVSEQLINIESGQFDKATLLEIYNNL